MGDTTKKNELRSAVEALLKNPAADLSQSAAAARMGVSAAALNQWLQGKYKGSNAALEGKVERWLESYSAGCEMTRELPPEPDWVETPTARRVYQTLETAQFVRTLTMVYGAPGVGKTMTCRQYVETRSNAWLVTPTKAAASVRGILHLLKQELGITRPASNNYDIQQMIFRRVNGSAGLIIIDEAQQLNLSALDELRQIQDLSGVGMALVGNEPLYTQMTGGYRAPKFAQLFSRIAQRTHIEGTRPADVAALAESIGITSRAAVEYLSRIGTLPGGLRGVTKTVQLAQLAAAGKGCDVDAVLIEAAWRRLTGS